jgi:hypothetical protein
MTDALSKDAEASPAASAPTIEPPVAPDPAAAPELAAPHDPAAPSPTTAPDPTAAAATSATPAGPTTAPPRRSWLARSFNWFWRGREISELVRHSVPVPAHSRELHRRAQLTNEIARLALEPPGPLRHGSGEAVACELYRQSVFWTLAALATASGDALAAHKQSLATLWQRADRTLLLQAAADPDSLSEVEAALTGSSFVDFAELDPERQRSLAWDLRRFVDALLTSLDRRQALLDRYRLQRLARVSFTVLLVLFLLPGVMLYRTWQDKRGDLARDRPWKTSSSLMPACDSPAQTCSQTPGFFFHTADEENPWVLIELGGKYPIKRVQVVNRTDCCPERAAPLVVEVSTDKKNWKTVAQRNESFSTWDATFSSTQARHVRVRALRRTMLHLSRVRVYR